MNHIRAHHASAIHYPAELGRQVFCGIRQSMPSSRYPSWAGVIDTLPSVADGQMNRPRSSFFVNRRAPWPVSISRSGQALSRRCGRIAAV